MCMIPAGTRLPTFFQVPDLSRGLSPRGGSQVIVVSACIDGSHGMERDAYSDFPRVCPPRPPFLGLTRDADGQKRRSSSSGGLTGSLRSFLPFSPFFLLFRLGVLTPAFFACFFLCRLFASRSLARSFVWLPYPCFA